jgi:hypothetical protein
MNNPLKAQGIVEYVLIITLILVILILSLGVMGVSVRDAYCLVVGGLDKGGICSTTCQDGFDNMNGWKKYNFSGWAIQNGQLCITKTGEQQLFNQCSFGSNIPADYVINLDNAQLFSGSGYGLFFRLQNSKDGIANGYAFQYDPGLGNRFVIRKWVNGWEINPPLALSAPYPQFTWYNQPHKIQVVVKGNRFDAYVDGSKVLTATDNTYQSGGSGMRSWDNTQACFDSYSMSTTK